MIIRELEQLTRDYLTDIYKRKYIGKIKVIPLEPKGYSFQIGRAVEYQPFIISLFVDDDKLLPLLKKEIKNLKLQYIDFGELNKVQPYNECYPESTSCCCDERGIN